MSHHVLLRAVVSSHEPSCHLMSRCVLSWAIMTLYELLCHLMRHHVISWAIVSFHEPSCHLMSRCVISWDIMLSHEPLCHLMVHHTYPYEPHKSSCLCDAAPRPQWRGRGSWWSRPAARTRTIRGTTRMFSPKVTNHSMSASFHS